MLRDNYQAVHEKELLPETTGPYAQTEVLGEQNVKTVHMTAQVRSWCVYACIVCVSCEISAGQTNVAVHKSYQITPPPSYELCTGPSDLTELTDDAALGSDWEETPTVGWRGIPEPPQITIDLNQSYKLEEVDLYSIGGGVGEVEYPSYILILVSQDGVNYGLAGYQSSQGLPSAYQGDFVKVPHTFVIRFAPVRARYVKVWLQPGQSRFMFLDEIKVFDNAQVDDSELRAFDDLVQISSWDQMIAVLQSQDRARNQVNLVLDGLDQARDTISDEDWQPLQIQAQALRDQVDAVSGQIWDDAIVAQLSEASSLLRADIYAAVYHRPWFWIEANPMDSVSADKVYLSDQSGGALSMNAWDGEGEWVVFNLFNATRSPVTTTIQMEEFRKPDQSVVNMSNLFQLRRTVFVQTSGNAIIADALPKTGPAGFEINPGAVVQCWLRFRGGLPYGTYSGSVNVAIQSGAASLGNESIPITMHIKNIEFPAETTLSSCVWAYVGVSGDTVGHEDEVANDLQTHHTSVFIIHHERLVYPTEISSAGDILKEKNRQVLDTVLQRHQYPKFYLLYLAFSEEELDRQMFAPTVWMSPAWKKAFRTWLTSIVQQLADNGVGYDRFAIYSFDENIDVHFRELAAFIKSIDPRIQIFANSFGGGPEKYNAANEYVDIWCVHRQQAYTHTDWFEDLQGFGKPIWWYEEKGPGKLNNPYSYYRLMPWQMHQLGVSGVGFWSYSDLPVSTGWNDGGDAFGRYAIVYGTSNPPVDVMGEGLVPSRRWEAWREGIEDYEYIHRLEQVISQLESSDPESAAQWRAWLANQVSLVVDNPNDTQQAYLAREAITNTVLALEQSQSDNRPPVLSLVPSLIVTYGTQFQVPVQTSDPDGDVVTVRVEPMPDNATFVDNVFTWTPTAADEGMLQLDFLASDGVLEATQTLPIEILAPNLPPSFTLDEFVEVGADRDLALTLDATDPESDPVQFALVSGPAEAQLQDDVLYWHPTHLDIGQHDVTLSASDATHTVTRSTVINVFHTNRPPQIQTIQQIYGEAQQQITFVVTATDPDGDNVILTASNLPAGAEFVDGQFAWTPTLVQTGYYAVLFVADDGQITAEQTVTLDVAQESLDLQAPQLRSISPKANAVQVPLNTMVYLELNDNNAGLDASSISILADGAPVYSGDIPEYTSSRGICRRQGMPAKYQFMWQPEPIFDYDQTVEITVLARDLAGNVMSPVVSRFTTEMTTFGGQTTVSLANPNESQGVPSTVVGSDGTVWVTWHQGSAGQRNIFVAGRHPGQTEFSPAVKVGGISTDQMNPSLVLAENGNLLLCWQEKSLKTWDLALGSSPDGQNWTVNRSIEILPSDQTQPRLATDDSRIWLTWVDNRQGNQDIFVASSDDVFESYTVQQVTNHSANQSEPVLVTYGGIVYVFWTDLRKGSADLYAARSDANWQNKDLVLHPANQSEPTAAVDPATGMIHLAWVDDRSGQSDIYYGVANRTFSNVPLLARNLLDDTTGSRQFRPSMMISEDESTSHVFVVWEDFRNDQGGSGDSDIYYVNATSATGTNVLAIKDDQMREETAPVVALGTSGKPYLVWVREDDQAEHVQYAATTVINAQQLASDFVMRDAGGVVGTAFDQIQAEGDVGVEVPSGALWTNLRIKINRIENPAGLQDAGQIISAYDFGPSSDLEFARPVTITIPYSTDTPAAAQVAWYNPQTGLLSQSGITGIEVMEISPSLNAVRFKASHFSQYIVHQESPETNKQPGKNHSSGGGCTLQQTDHVMRGFGSYLLSFILLMGLWLRFNRNSRRKNA